MNENEFQVGKYQENYLQGQSRDNFNNLMCLDTDLKNIYKSNTIIYSHEILFSLRNYNHHQKS